MSAYAFLALFRKDLKLFFQDRRAVLMSFAAPILIGAFFGFLFSGSAKGGTAKVPLSLVDLDQSVVSGKLRAALATESTLEVRVESLEVATSRVRKGKASVALVLPRGFAEAATHAFFNSGPKPAVRFLYDPSHQAELGMVKGLLTQHAIQVVSQEAFTGVSGRSAVKSSLQQLEGDTAVPPKDRAMLKDLLTSVDRFNERSPAGKGAPCRGCPCPSA